MITAKRTTTPANPRRIWKRTTFRTNSTTAASATTISTTMRTRRYAPDRRPRERRRLHGVESIGLIWIKVGFPGAPFACFAAVDRRHGGLQPPWRRHQQRAGG